MENEKKDRLRKDSLTSQRYKFKKYKQATNNKFVV